eukprot:7410395-Alexandrium_andersonii.AAC.1
MTTSSHASGYVARHRRGWWSNLLLLVLTRAFRRRVGVNDMPRKADLMKPDLRARLGLLRCDYRLARTHHCNRYSLIHNHTEPQTLHRGQRGASEDGLPRPPCIISDPEFGRHTAAMGFGVPGGSCMVFGGSPQGHRCVHRESHPSTSEAPEGPQGLPEVHDSVLAVSPESPRGQSPEGRRRLLGVPQEGHQRSPRLLSGGSFEYPWR